MEIYFIHSYSGFKNPDGTQIVGEKLKITPHSELNEFIDVGENVEIKNNKLYVEGKPIRRMKYYYDNRYDWSK